MSDNIFFDTAPKLWAKGIPAIPLIPRSKRPPKELVGWSRFSDSMPTADEQSEWLSTMPRGNIGLPLGKQSGLIMIDIDYDAIVLDEKGEQIDVGKQIIDALKRELPQTPWERVGKKGVVLAYRYNGERAKKYQAEESNDMVVEVLSHGNYVVLPPSIHPETQRPYVANSDLADVYEQIPFIQGDIDDIIYRAVHNIVPLKKRGFNSQKFKATEYVPLGTRDVQMVRHAGWLARQILFGNLNVREALNDMQDWFNNKVQTVEGDTIDVSKGHAKILQFLIEDVREKGKVLPLGWDTDLTADEIKEWHLDFSEESKKWTYDELIKHIMDVYNNHSKDSPQRMSCIDFILKKISISDDLTTTEIDRVLAYLRADMKITLSSLKKQLNEVARGENIEGISHTEIALETIQQLNKRMTFHKGDPEENLAYFNDKIWIWAGSHWTPFSESEVRRFIQENYGNLKMSTKFSDHKQIVNVMMDSLPQVLAKTPIDGVNFANGFLRSDGKLVEHHKDFGMTYTLPFQYDPLKANSCPMFMEFLRSAWDEEDDFQTRVMALQEALCVTLFGMGTRYQRAFLLYGQANSGKSVLMDIISEMVPEQARTAIGPEKWGDDYNTASFVGSLLNQAGELSSTDYIDGKSFKETVDGSEITARNPYGRPFKFRPKAAHWFASNHLPKTKDTSGGFNRRWLIFSFEKVVPPECIIRGLAQTIIYNEMDAIIAWAVGALQRVLKQENFSFPSSHDRYLAEMSQQNSTVRTWMAERIIITTEKTPVLDEYSDIYRDYWSWAASRSQRSISPRLFGTEFDRFLKESRHQGVLLVDGVRKYCGLKIKEGN